MSGGSVLGRALPVRASTRCWYATNRLPYRRRPTCMFNAAGRHFLRRGDGQARVDPALVDKRLDELVAQYIAEGPTEAEVQRAATARGRRPHSRARAGRRLWRQGGHPRRRPDLRRRQRLLQEDAGHLCSRHPGRSASGDAPVVDPPALSVRLEPGERPPYVDAKFTPEARSKPRPRRRCPVPSGPSGGRPACRARFPDHHPYRLGQWHEGRLCAARLRSPSPRWRCASTPAMRPTRRPSAASRH